MLMDFFRGMRMDSNSLFYLFISNLYFLLVFAYAGCYMGSPLIVGN
jgi:hypothetical protein